MDFARTQIEWMSTECIKQFDNSRDNPFAFRMLTTCRTMEDCERSSGWDPIHRRFTRPCLIMATSHTLDSGFSQVPLFCLCFMKYSSQWLTLQMNRNCSYECQVIHEIW
jgi:hypothetical protein